MLLAGPSHRAFWDATRPNLNKRGVSQAFTAAVSEFLDGAFQLDSSARLSLGALSELGLCSWATAAEADAGTGEIAARVRDVGRCRPK